MLHSAAEIAQLPAERKLVKLPPVLLTQLKLMQGAADAYALHLRCQ